MIIQDNGKIKIKCVILYYIIVKTVDMDFTDLSSFSSSHQGKNKNNKEALSTLNDFSFQPINQQYSNLLEHLKEINSSRSVSPSTIAEQLQTQIQMEKGELREVEEVGEEEIAYNFSPQQVKCVPSRKSNIFLKNIHKFNNFEPTTESHLSRIKIYYFQQPIFKLLQYSSQTTMSQLISKSLSAYMSEKLFEQTYIYSIDPSDYELRFPLSEENFKPDLTIDAIQSDRLVVESLFETLVLVVRENGMSPMRKSHRMIQKSIEEFIGDNMKKVVTIHLFNSNSAEIGSITLCKESNISPIFQYIRANQVYLQKFYISETLKDDHELPQDFEVQYLTSYNLYVKEKRFADESQENSERPIIIVKSFAKKHSPSQIIPIGIVQASMYEEFEVTKINSRGMKQARILGIDQMKIYNYDSDLRKEKKEVGFLSKIFGNNEETGTKRPYRLMSEVKSIEEMEGGVRIEFVDKKIDYLVENEESREQILKKVRFLLLNNSK